MTRRGPLTDEQIDALIARFKAESANPRDILQTAARIAIAHHRPGLLTDKQIGELIDMDTLCERGDHSDLHASYQSAASMGAMLVLELAIRIEPRIAGPACYVCKLCDSARAVNPESIAHRDECAEIRARIRGTA